VRLLAITLPPAGFYNCDLSGFEEHNARLRDWYQYLGGHLEVIWRSAAKRLKADRLVVDVSKKN
jgi:hypothetical protein